MASTVDGAYLNLLQGVSQQNASMRIAGQLNEQTNMMSDLLNSIRRRLGLPLKKIISIPNVTKKSLYTTYIDRGVKGRHLLINTVDGSWVLLDKDTFEEIVKGQDDYFKASSSSAISSCALGMDIYINNSEMIIETETNSEEQDPSTTGFAFARTSAYSMNYNINIQHDGKSYSVSYTTPKGLEAGDAEKATPKYIAQFLYDELMKLEDPPEIFIKDQYLFFKGVKINVSTTTSNVYFVTSGFNNVKVTNDLPPSLPDEAKDMMVSVGLNAESVVWYKYDTESASWLETGAYGSVSKINNTPRCLEFSDEMTTPKFEGRLAGDDNSNEDPAFVKYKICTGVGAFQGRLVILCGPFVCMSDSQNPYRFYRKTVNQLLPTDRIDIGSGSSQSVTFRSCFQFNRDLLLFSDSAQAVIVGSGAVVTSQTAAITLTSEYSCNSQIRPISIGNTLLYPFTRSATNAGLWELVPSSYTSSQYESLDATSHIPEYIDGNIRHLVSSSSSNVAMCTGDKDTSVYVYEYQWGQEGTKIQSAWHKWILPLKILSMHFAHEKLYLFLESNLGGGKVVCTELAPREGFDYELSSNVPYLDLFLKVNIKDRNFTVPEDIINLGISSDKYTLSMVNGSYAMGIVGIESIIDNKGTAVRGTPNGEYYLGVKYTSSFTPTPPFIKDANDKPIGTGKIRLVEMSVIVNNTGQFNASISDRKTGVNYSMPLSGANMNSLDLELDKPILATDSMVYIPCRSNADTTLVTLSTDSSQEMNILSIQYKLRYNFSRKMI